MWVQALEGESQIIVFVTVIYRTWVELKATVLSLGGSTGQAYTGYTGHRKTQWVHGAQEGRAPSLQCRLRFPGIIWERNEVLYKVIYIQA